MSISKEEQTQIPQKIPVKNNNYFHKYFTILKIKFFQDHGLIVLFQMYDKEKKNGLHIIIV